MHEKSKSSVTVCTLAEGSHFHGLPALINSLHKSGFRGDLIVGYRGILPKWLKQLPAAESDYVSAALNAEGLKISPIELTHPRLPLPMMKPHLIEKCFSSIRESDVDGVLFLDSDIVCNAPWSLLDAWVRTDLLLVQDYGYPIVPPPHPWRQAWGELVKECGYQLNNHDIYCISACVGFSRSRAHLVETWQELSEHLGKRSSKSLKFKDGERLVNPFFGTDQDLLNAALMTQRYPVSATSCDFLGFRGNLQHLVHPTGKKPWKKNLWWDFLVRGRPPTNFDMCYFQAPPGPVPHYQRRRRFSAKLLKFLGRFYKA